MSGWFYHRLSFEPGKYYPARIYFQISGLKFVFLFKWIFLYWTTAIKAEQQFELTILIVYLNSFRTDGFREEVYFTPCVWYATVHCEAWIKMSGSQCTIIFAQCNTSSVGHKKVNEPGLMLSNGETKKKIEILKHPSLLLTCLLPPLVPQLLICSHHVIDPDRSSCPPWTSIC